MAFHIPMDHHSGKSSETQNHHPLPAFTTPTRRPRVDLCSCLTPERPSHSQLTPLEILTATELLAPPANQEASGLDRRRFELLSFSPRVPDRLFNGLYQEYSDKHIFYSGGANQPLELPTWTSYWPEFSNGRRVSLCASCFSATHRCLPLLLELYLYYKSPQKKFV